MQRILELHYKEEHQAYTTEGDYHSLIGMMYVSVCFRSVCNGDLFSYACIFAKRCPIPHKPTWCIAATETCLEGDVLNAMAARLVVEQFIQSVGHLNL